KDEAKRRGLPNLRTTPEALKPLLDEKNIALFEKYGVLNRIEMVSRYEVFIEEYTRKVQIEAGLAINMARTMIIPAINAYLARLAASANSPWKNDALDEIGKSVANSLSEVSAKVKVLEAEFAKKNNIEKVKEAMASLRKSVDEAEGIVEDWLWPLPKYRELLFIY
ncbi:MAG: hypothetical protein IKO42_07075, partial [Opitutales bacterium]|nr:hypothetical protein [Opitutales bacterium]